MCLSHRQGLHTLNFGRWAKGHNGTLAGVAVEGPMWPCQKATSLIGKWTVAKQMIGRRLSQAEARRLLAKLE